MLLCCFSVVSQPFLLLASDHDLAIILGAVFPLTVISKYRKWHLKVSVKENEVPTEKNSSRASIFATLASYISN